MCPRVILNFILLSEICYDHLRDDAQQQDTELPRCEADETEKEDGHNVGEDEAAQAPDAVPVADRSTLSDGLLLLVVQPPTPCNLRRRGMHLFLGRRSLCCFDVDVRRHVRRHVADILRLRSLANIGSLHFLHVRFAQRIRRGLAWRGSPGASRQVVLCIASSAAVAIFCEYNDKPFERNQSGQPDQ